MDYIETKKKKGFQKGVSGNPLGRKRGQPSKISVMREALAKELPEILAATVALAKSGDQNAIRLILERTLPALKPQEQAQALQIPSDGSLMSKAHALLDGVTFGEIPLGSASQLITSITALARVVELEGFEKRLETLERVNHEKN